MDLDSSSIENRTFDIVRRGYDKEQVQEFLSKVSGSVSRVNERRKIAEVRAEQLERELHDVKHRAEVTVQETVAARIRMLEIQGNQASAGTGTMSPHASRDHASIEAHQIIEQANVRAQALQAEAEAVLEGALATSAKINDDRAELLGSVGAERMGIVAAAEEEAQAIREAAQLAAEQTRAAAARETEQMRAETERATLEIRRRAETEAELIAADAETRAAGVVARAERERDSLVEQMERSRADMEALEREQFAVVSAEAAEPAAIIEEAPAEPEGESMTESPGSADEPSVIDDREPKQDADRSEEFERIMIDLRREVADERDDTDDAGRQTRPSRYRSRSANLPHLGEDATSVIGSLESLRGKD